MSWAEILGHVIQGRTGDKRHDTIAGYKGEASHVLNESCCMQLLGAEGETNSYLIGDFCGMVAHVTIWMHHGRLK